MDYVEQLAKQMYEDCQAEHGNICPWEETRPWFRRDCIIQARMAIHAIESLAKRGGPKLVANCDRIETQE